MADYIPITEGQSDPEAPVDSSLIKRLRDNPIAIAEGAAGAPKVQGVALGGIHLGFISRASNNPIGFNDLDGFDEILLIGSIIFGVSSPSFQIRFSEDNGATFGSYETITSFATSSGARKMFGNLLISKTRQKVSYSLIAIDDGLSDTAIDQSGDQAITIPASANAFQVRVSVTSLSIRFALNCFLIGGQP